MTVMNQDSPSPRDRVDEKKLENASSYLEKCHSRAGGKPLVGSGFELGKLGMAPARA